MLLAVLDIAFTLAHAIVVVAILTLWIPKRTRRLHGILVALTTLSWFGLGAVYGWGYCFLTDWHWRVRDALDKPHPGGFIKFAVDALGGGSVPPSVVDTVTLVVFVSVALVSLWLNIKQREA